MSDQIDYKKTSLVILSNASRMLAQVQTIDDAKHVMSVAASAKLYAKKHDLGKQAVGYAHEIEISAEIKLGEILKAMDKNKGGDPVSHANRVDEPPTFSQIGVSKQLASEAQALAALPPEEKEQVVKQKKSKKRAIGEHKREKKKADLAKTQDIRGKYRVIYADPPWSYGNSGAGIDQYGPAERHYPAMSIAQLCAIKISDIAEDDAVLFLWVTSPLLEECFAVIKAWGFKYKTSFVWDKVKHNYGHYNSVRHELLLVCTRGSCTPDTKKLFDSVQTIERSDVHSEKPEEFRVIIDALYLSGKRIELFARKKAQGWEAYGNEL